MPKENQYSEKPCFLNVLTITLLPFLFLIGLILGYINFIPIHVEIHTLIIILFIFTVFILFSKHNANYAACHMQNSFFKMEEYLQDKLRENALTIMGKTKSTLYVNDFMDDYYKDIRNDNFARVAPSIFPMLGILGTFIAIAISMPDFTLKDIDVLDREISILLSGIGTAFYASIYGISLSLIWTYFEKVGTSKIDKNLYELEKLYDSHVWKKAELIKHKHMQSELKDQEIINTLKDTFNIDFIKEINEQYLKNFILLNENMKDASAELRDTIDRIHTRQESVNAVENIKNNIEGFNSNAENLQKSMERFDITVSHTFSKIDYEIGEVIEKLSIFANLISEQNLMILEKTDELKKDKRVPHV